MRAATRGATSARKRRIIRRLWSREKLRVRKGGERSKKGRWRGKILVVRISAPELMTLEPDVRNDALTFLATIRDRSRTSGVQLLLDFRPMQKVTPLGCVLLVAELDRALADGSTRIQAHPASQPIIHQVLEQVGIYKRLGVKCDVTPTDESVIHWRSASGVLAEGQTGGSLLENYEGRLAEGIRKGLYAGIVEAMTNTVHHAYVGADGAQLRRFIGHRWWMLSQEKDDILTVAMCDLGIGIPRSLPKSGSFAPGAIVQMWTALGLDRTDASALKVALEMGKTRTEMKGRGKGLSDIIEAVKLSPEGSVYLGSQRGIFTAHKGKSMARNHSRPIRGTVVHWTVPIAELGT